VNETPNFVMPRWLEHDTRLRHKPRPQDLTKPWSCPNKQRSRTVKFVTIAFASAIALSAIVPAFAYENDLEGGASAPNMHPGKHQAAVKRTGQHRGVDAKAYAPISVPADTPSYGPNYDPNYGPWDFGIGSQS
jgi:hypothetical protein